MTTQNTGNREQETGSSERETKRRSMAADNAQGSIVAAVTAGEPVQRDYQRVWCSDVVSKDLIAKFERVETVKQALLEIRTNIIKAGVCVRSVHQLCRDVRDEWGGGDYNAIVAEWRNQDRGCTQTLKTLDEIEDAIVYLGESINGDIERPGMLLLELKATDWAMVHFLASRHPHGLNAISLRLVSLLLVTLCDRPDVDEIVEEALERHERIWERPRLSPPPPIQREEPIRDRKDFVRRMKRALDGVSRKIAHAERAGKAKRKRRDVAARG